MFFKVQVFQGPVFSGSRFFRVQVFQGPGFQEPGPRSRVWVQILEVALVKRVISLVPDFYQTLYRD